MVAGDILEHVVEPHPLLSDLVGALRRGGEILVSVPNFGHWYPRGRTAVGKFDYDQRGPLDRGHLRFFTRDSIEALIANCGLRDHRARAPSARRSTCWPAGSPQWRERLAAGAARGDRVATRVWPRLFGYQFLYRLEVHVIPAPGTDRNKLVGTTVGLLVGGTRLLPHASSTTRSPDPDRGRDRLLLRASTTSRRGASSTGTSTCPTAASASRASSTAARRYMYFPPWPAILRLPVLMTTHEYDGRLTLLSMALAWIVFAVMVTKLVWLAACRPSRRRGRSRRTSAASGRGVPRGATGGTFLTFDAAQPWVYHEAYVWAVASVVRRHLLAGRGC